MKLIGRGKDKIVFLLTKNDKRPIIQTNFNLVFSLLQTKFDNLSTEDVEIILKEQKRQMAFLNKSREKYLVNPIEVGVYDEDNRKLYPALTLFKNKKTFPIPKLVPLLKFETAKIYQIYPHVQGDTFNEIVDSGRMTHLLEKSLARTLNSFFQKYAHFDLTGTNLMYGSIDGSIDGSSKKTKKWYIIDNEQVKKYSKLTRKKLTKKNILARKKNTLLPGLSSLSSLSSLFNNLPLDHPDRNNLNILVDEIKNSTGLSSGFSSGFFGQEKGHKKNRDVVEIIDLT